MAIDEKYYLISDCPLIEDEVGNRIGPVSSDFCGGHMKGVSWSTYFLLHKEIPFESQARSGSAEVLTATFICLTY